MAVVVTVFYAPRVLVKQCAHCELSPELAVLPLIHDLLVRLSGLESPLTVVRSSGVARTMWGLLAAGA